MPRRNPLESPEGRANLAARALTKYAESVRLESRLRCYSGPQWAEHRSILRDHARHADELARLIRSGAYAVDPIHEED